MELMELNRLSRRRWENTTSPSEDWDLCRLRMRSSTDSTRVRIPLSRTQLVADRDFFVQSFCEFRR